VVSVGVRPGDDTAAIHQLGGFRQQQLKFHLISRAGIGALVGAYVNRQKDGRSLSLVGINQRIRQALQVTRVETLFHFFNTIAEAEQSL
jgi:anti-anti-sigma regulatory factor